MVDLISSYIGRLWLKTWSKSDLPIAETAWPIYLQDTYVIVVFVFVYDKTIKARQL